MKEKNKRENFFSESSKIWLTAMGLAISVMLIIGLILLIFKNGLQLFSIKDIATLQLQDGSVLVGEIVKKQKIDSLQNVTEATTEKKIIAIPPYEYQIYIANRNFYNKSFVYVPANDVTNISYDAQMAKIIRLEYGPVIGNITHLQTSTFSLNNNSQEGTVFKKQFNKILKENIKKRSIINNIEKNQIGKINDKISREKIAIKIAENKLKRSSLTTQKKAMWQKKITNSKQILQRLESDYQKLADKSANIRKTINDAIISVQIANPEANLRIVNSDDYSHHRTAEIEIKNILSYTTPNAYNVFTKSYLYGVNVVKFLFTNPREANTEGGIFPAIFGTFVMTVLMSILVVPIGVVVAIYLKEYTKKGWLLNFIRISISNLAGVPSIVFGVFGVGFFIYFVGGTIDQLFFSAKLPTPTFGTGGVLWASLTLALLTIPVVVVATEEALNAIPNSHRQGALACGATKWQTIWHVILPSASPGILTGFILAMTRGAGEVAPLMIVGAVKLAPSLAIDTSYPFIHLERKFMHLGFHIYDLGFQSPDSEAALPMVFASTLTLLLLILVLNISAIFIRKTLRNKFYKSSSVV